MFVLVKGGCGICRLKCIVLWKERDMFFFNSDFCHTWLFKIEYLYIDEQHSVSKETAVNQLKYGYYIVIHGSGNTFINIPD